MKTFFLKYIRYALIAVVCAFSPSACATTQMAGECPESRTLKCLAGKTCVPAKGRGCQVCFCNSPEQKTPGPDENAINWNPPPIN
jgi:hypothetical protein